MIYRTKNGDTVDGICWKFYESSAMTVRVYDENRHLAEYDAVLPAGVEVFLPKQEEVKSVKPSVTLFG